MAGGVEVRSKEQDTAGQRAAWFGRVHGRATIDEAVAVPSGHMFAGCTTRWQHCGSQRLGAWAGVCLGTTGGSVHLCTKAGRGAFGRRGCAGGPSGRVGHVAGCRAAMQEGCAMPQRQRSLQL